jgi:D-threo-aldose 1-dehydrogenase
MTSTLRVPGSDVSIGRVGFGCARINGDSEFRSSARLVEAALRAGIRHFDTAPSYGLGMSEAVLGSVLAGVADATVATKVGIARQQSGTRPSPLRRVYRATLRPLLSRLPGVKARLLRLANRAAAAVAPPPRVLTRDEVMRNLETSLQQLNRSRVDLYLLHEPQQFHITDELREVFDSLKRDGVIGAYGLAYDTYSAPAAAFGTVVQGRYPFEPPRFEPATRIFHGVLRHAWHAQKADGVRAPGEWLRHVLDTHRDSAVIFSASSNRQIEGVMETFN